jgi:hypothetical protein
MESYREYPSEFDLGSATEVAASEDVVAAIGTDERRMHVRAYNHWVSLLDGREFPSIEDLEPADVQDFATHSVLLDFTCGGENPSVPYIGAQIRDECGLEDDTRTIGDVPSRSLLSRLTDHYLQIIANRAPIGFEAEFLNQREENIRYRGILMPFSSDGEAIDFIYGVINWKNVTGTPAELPIIAEVPGPERVIEVEEAEAELVLDNTIAVEPFEPVTEKQSEWEASAVADPDEEILRSVELEEDARLADRLWAARETAESVKAGEGRTRTALYRALSLAYDFAVATQQNPEDYAELLEESGVKAQARAPMTPIVKLVFGIDYDKARLTEFAAALSYARREQVALGAFHDFIENQPGGLKALVSAERQARRPEPKPDTRGDDARARLRSAPTISLAELTEEFAVVVTRRSADGRHEPVAVIDDETWVERAIRKAA